MSDDYKDVLDPIRHAVEEQVTAAYRRGWKAALYAVQANMTGRAMKAHGPLLSKLLRETPTERGR